MKRTEMQFSSEQISSLLSRKLNAYTLAAGAAGVTLLALTQPADAEVVYTPVHVILNGSRVIYDLDVNNDGVADFGFIVVNSSFGGALQVGAAGLVPDAVLFNGIGQGPAALNRNAAIGPGKSFYGCVGSCGYIFMATVFAHGSEGNWINVTNHYLGLKFYVGRDTYYGWARMSVRVKGITVSSVLTGYAYENIPNHAIHAGQTSGTFENPMYDEAKVTPESSASQPGQSASSQLNSTAQQSGTLGMLAMGAPGVPLWRREAPVAF